MKKMITLFCVMMLLMSSIVLAQDITRPLTMGDNNNVLLDDANIWLYPSRINDYPNLARGEFGWDGGDGEFSSFGIHWLFNEDNPWVLGTYFSVLSAYEPMDLIGADLVPFDMSLLDNRKLDIIYGRQLGANNFGFGWTVYHSSQTADATGDQSKESFSYHRFALGLTPINGAWDIAANIGLGTWTDESSFGDAETEADGLTDVSVQGRYFHQMNPTCTFIPHLGLAYSKRGINVNVWDTADGGVKGYDPGLDYSYTNTGTTMDIGVGLNYTPASNVLGVFDFGFMYNKVNREGEVADSAAFDSPLSPVFAGDQDVTTWFFPYFKIGLDADIFKWLDIRMGATNYWTSATSEAGANTYNSRWAENATYLGFGFHFNRLHIDTQADPGLFMNGFDFISGNGVPMHLQISATYEMM